MCTYPKLPLFVAALAVLMSGAAESVSVQPRRPSPEANGLRPWQPEDSSNVRYYAADIKEPLFPFPHGETVADWLKSPGWKSSGVFVSPDEERFFTLSYRGDLQRGVTIQDLEVFSSHGPGNGSIAAISGRSTNPKRTFGLFRQSIRDPRWESNSQGILFHKLTSEGAWQPFRLNLSSGRTEPVVGLRSDIDTSVLDHSAGTAVIRQNAYKEEFSETSSVTFPAQWLKRNRYGGIVQNREYGRILGDEKYRLKVGIQQYDLPTVYWASVSPDGKSVLLFRYDETKRRFFFELLSVSDRNPPKSIMRRDSAIVDLPTAAHAYWTADNQLILVGVAVESEVLFENINAGLTKLLMGIEVFDLKDGSWRQIDRVRRDGFQIAGWNQSANRLTASRTSETGKKVAVAYVRDGPGWARRELSEDSRRIEIEQRGNVPPHLVVVQRGRAKRLTASDPALNGVRILPVRDFEWRAPDGEVVQGTLILPEGLNPAEAAPLVIQASYILSSAIFLPDGINSTGQAAQALAAKGMAVLTMKSFPHDGNNPITLESLRGTELQRSRRTEAPYFMGIMDSAIDALAQRGIVKRGPIGLLGFSRTGYMTNYAMTHPARTQIVAGAVNDSTTQSYQEYLGNAANVGRDRDVQGFFALNRGPWVDPDHWLRDDVMLNADRMTGATMLLKNSLDDPARYDDISLQQIGALIINKKPVDALFAAPAAHNIGSPIQQRLVRHANVDWFAFWLKGEVDPDPSKAEQYRRWKKMAADWQKTQDGYISRGEPGFINTRSGMAYNIVNRKVGDVAKPGDRLTIRYRYLGTGQADHGQAAAGQSAGPAQAATVTLSPNTLGQGDVYADQAGMKGLDECLQKLHPGEKAICIYPSERMAGGQEAPAKTYRRDSGNMARTNATPHRYEVELVSVAPGSASMGAVH